MRLILRFIVLAALLLGAGGCRDAVMLPQTNGRAPNMTTEVAPAEAPCCDGIIVIVPGPDPGCDPYTSLDFCNGDGGECITSQPGTQSPEHVVAMGCDRPGPGPGGGDPRTPGGGGGTSPPACPEGVDCEGSEPPPDTCVTNDPVINDNVVEAGFSKLWVNSNPGAAQELRVEQAAWIVQTGYGLEVVPWTNATFGPCTITPQMGSFAIPANAVGWVHTHPFTVGEVQTSCAPLGYTSIGQPIHGTYSSFPNSDDIELAALINQSLGRTISAYTIDQSTIVRFSATSTTTVSSYSQYGRCGY